MNLNKHTFKWKSCKKYFQFCATFISITGKLLIRIFNSKRKKICWKNNFNSFKPKSWKINKNKSNLKTNKMILLRLQGKSQSNTLNNLSLTIKKLYNYASKFRKFQMKILTLLFKNKTKSKVFLNRFKKHNNKNISK